MAYFIQVLYRDAEIKVDN